MEYIYTVGRRKTSTATVRLYKGKGESIVNDKKLKEYFPIQEHQRKLNLPFALTDTSGEFYFTAKTSGGGVAGQMGAVLLGISRGLVKYDETMKSTLSSNKLLTRDDRMVERKKTGRKKARKSPQFSKR